jgi:hypothetical protein
MGIIWLILVDVYKHFKILNSKLKVSRVGAYTSNVENSLHFNLGANNPYYGDYSLLCALYPNQIE